MRRTRRPPKDRKRLCHPDNRDFITFITGSQKDNLRGSPPIERPRYRNEILPTLQFRMDAASTNQESPILTPTNKLLWKFTLRPDISANSVNTPVRLGHWPNSSFPTATYHPQTANGKPLPNLKYPPHNPCTDYYPQQPSSTHSSHQLPIKTGKEKEGHPDAVPSLTGIHKLGFPLTKIEAVAVVIHSFIHFLHNTGNAIFCMTTSRYPQSTESYAFSKSTLKSSSSFFVFHASSTTSFAIRIPIV